MLAKGQNPPHEKDGYCMKNENAHPFTREVTGTTPFSTAFPQL